MRIQVHGMHARIGELLSIALLCFCIPMLMAQTPQKVTPGKEDVLITEALAAYQAGSLEIAIGKLQQAYKMAPSNAFARLYLGLLLYQKNAADGEAQRLMESAIDQFPSNPDLILRLTDSYLNSQKNARLASLLEHSKKTRTANHRLGLNIVYLLVRYDHLEPARRELNELSNAISGSASAGGTIVHELGEISFLRGLIAAAGNRKEEALRLFQEADRSEFPPRESPQMRMLAEALRRLDECRLSAQAYQVYLAHFPEDNDARMDQAMAYITCASYDRAREQLQRVFEQAPSTPHVNLYLGLLLLDLKANNEAQRHFEAELKSDPSSYQAMAQLAYLAYMQGDAIQSRKWLQKAAALNADWMEIHFVYGLLNIRERKYDLAIKSLERALSQSPDHMKARYHLSIAYLRAGNEAKANENREIYERMVAANKAKALGEDTRRK